MENNSGKFHWDREAIKMQKKQCAMTKQEHSKKKEQHLRMQNQNSTICIGGILDPKIHTKKKKSILKNNFKYKKASCIVFCAKLYLYSHQKHGLQEESKNFGLQV